jgi:hypothetical protein
MKQNLKHIEEFIEKHHVLNLATSWKNSLSICSIFYVYDSEHMQFIFASSYETTHIQHIQKNPQVAGNIVLETDVVGKIQGLQISGVCTLVENSTLKKIYFAKYPYALALMPTLWCLHVKQFKMTDNKFGFGKKLYYP